MASVQWLGTREVEQISLMDTVNTSSSEVGPPPVLIRVTVRLTHEAEQITHGCGLVLADELDHVVEHFFGFYSRSQDDLGVLVRIATPRLTLTTTLATPTVVITLTTTTRTHARI